MRTTLLVVAPLLIAEPVAAALRKNLDADVAVAPNRRAATQILRRDEFALTLLDSSLTTGDPEAVDLLYSAAESTPVLEVNFGLTNEERITRQVRGALARRAQDHAQAQAAVKARLHHELNGTLAGLLLEAQLALRDAEPAQKPKLQKVVDLASSLRESLRVET